jgi:eukaryotic-like serine/threonine-protein kinase
MGAPSPYFPRRANAVSLPAARLAEIDRAFDRALDLPPSERSTFVARLAEADRGLAAAVQDLLTGSEVADPRVATASAARDLALVHEQFRAAADLAPGDVIDRFRVIEEIGRGGMAVVYLAQRADGAFEQTVAIKRLHYGLGTLGALQRFDQERQILASLNHASIGRLLDGGVDASGFPFLVMEYVEGVAIDRYANERKLAVRERLDLFVRVARAVDYAHRHLVVHRDIKPSNILVTPDGEVKLLDFGIAKLMDAQEPADAPITRTVFRALTPEYASPEQLAGTRITIGSDVYQLGLLLYELITGVRACDRKTAPAAHARVLRGDLDNIVAMALAPLPDARYATAAALADDVLRHLSGQAVVARGEARLYRARRFVRRHAIGLAALAAIVALLVAIAVNQTVQASRLAEERDRVRVEAAKAQGVTRFLLGLFEIPPSAAANYASLTARDVLEYRAARVDDLADQPPVVQAEIMSTVGLALLRLGSLERGAALAQRSLDVRRRAVGDEHVDTAESRFLLGTGLNMLGRPLEAEPHLRHAVAIRERLLGPAHVDVAEALTELAMSLRRLDRPADALPLLTRALAIDRAAGHEHEARVLNNLGLVASAVGDDEAAERHYSDAIAYRRARFGSHPDLPINLINLARLYQRRGAPQRAVPLLEEALAGRQRIFGDAHASTATARLQLASAHVGAGDFVAAERRLREQERLLDPKDAALQRTLAGQFITLYERWGKPKDAARYRASTAGRD